MDRKDMDKQPHHDKPEKTNNKTQITNNIQLPKHKFKKRMLVILPGSVALYLNKMP